ncbi:sugar transferase [[Clostridium] fimetarium]|uniref:Uncharacterized protein n=1 Tax=[Clostridium] fimetarium TaxID=99656 RepID=A0A1I0RNP2_9FIRM|nr:sugar transferase [[Clostridium] fimetarium]SEW42738.1 hypothetical protein SAMN05421659_11968 [[Clostridium] fimetarium]
MVKNEIRGFMLKMKNDPRITSVGKLIRNSSERTKMLGTRVSYLNRV